MCDKQVYELTLADIKRYGVWFFPMDDLVEDELTVHPLLKEESGTDYQLIVRAEFFDKCGGEYLGYLYWTCDEAIDSLKPVILLSNGEAISFWSGVVQPSWEVYSKEAQEIRGRMPMTFVSEVINTLEKKTGVLEGLYFLDGINNVCIK